VGCWAYALPAFAILKFGLESGCSNNRLELAAVVHGLADVVALDHTRRPIHAFTDSEFVLCDAARCKTSEDACYERYPNDNRDGSITRVVSQVIASDSRRDLEN